MLWKRTKKNFSNQIAKSISEANIEMETNEEAMDIEKTNEFEYVVREYDELNDSNKLANELSIGFLEEDSSNKMEIDSNSPFTLDLPIFTHDISVSSPTIDYIESRNSDQLSNNSVYIPLTTSCSIVEETNESSELSCLDSKLKTKRADKEQSNTNISFSSEKITYKSESISIVSVETTKKTKKISSDDISYIEAITKNVNINRISMVYPILFSDDPLELTNSIENDGLNFFEKEKDYCGVSLAKKGPGGNKRNYNTFKKENEFKLNEGKGFVSEIILGGEEGGDSNLQPYKLHSDFAVYPHHQYNHPSSPTFSPCNKKKKMQPSPRQSSPISPTSPTFPSYVQLKNNQNQFKQYISQKDKLSSSSINDFYNKNDLYQRDFSLLLPPTSSISSNSSTSTLTMNSNMTSSLLNSCFFSSEKISSTKSRDSSLSIAQETKESIMLCLKPVENDIDDQEYIDKKDLHHITPTSTKNPLSPLKMLLSPFISSSTGVSSSSSSIASSPSVNKNFLRSLFSSPCNNLSEEYIEEVKKKKDIRFDIDTDEKSSNKSTIILSLSEIESSEKEENEKLRKKNEKIWTEKEINEARREAKEADIEARDAYREARIEKCFYDGKKKECINQETFFTSITTTSTFSSPSSPVSPLPISPLYSPNPIYSSFFIPSIPNSTTSSMFSSITENVSPTVENYNPSSPIASFSSSFSLNNNSNNSSYKDEKSNVHIIKEKLKDNFVENKNSKQRKIDKGDDKQFDREINYYLYFKELSDDEREELEEQILRERKEEEVQEIKKNILEKISNFKKINSTTSQSSMSKNFFNSFMHTNIENNEDIEFFDRKEIEIQSEDYSNKLENLKSNQNKVVDMSNNIYKVSEDIKTSREINLDEESFNRDIYPHLLDRNEAEMKRIDRNNLVEMNNILEANINNVLEANRINNDRLDIRTSFNNCDSNKKQLHDLDTINPSNIISKEYFIDSFNSNKSNYFITENSQNHQKKSFHTLYDQSYTTCRQNKYENQQLQPITNSTSNILSTTTTLESPYESFNNIYTERKIIEDIVQKMISEIVRMSIEESENLLIQTRADIIEARESIKKINDESYQESTFEDKKDVKRLVYIEHQDDQPKINKSWSCSRLFILPLLGRSSLDKSLQINKTFSLTEDLSSVHESILDDFYDYDN